MNSSQGSQTECLYISQGTQTEPLPADSVVEDLVPQCSCQTQPEGNKPLALLQGSRETQLEVQQGSTYQHVYTVTSCRMLTCASLQPKLKSLIIAYRNQDVQHMGVQEGITQALCVCKIGTEGSSESAFVGPA